MHLIPAERAPAIGSVGPLQPRYERFRLPRVFSAHPVRCGRDEPLDPSRLGPGEGEAHRPVAGLQRSAADDVHLVCARGGKHHLSDGRHRLLAQHSGTPSARVCLQAVEQDRHHNDVDADAGVHAVGGRVGWGRQLPGQRLRRGCVQLPTGTAGWPQDRFQNGCHFGRPRAQGVWDAQADDQRGVEVPPLGGQFGGIDDLHRRCLGFTLPLRERREHRFDADAQVDEFLPAEAGVFVDAAARETLREDPRGVFLRRRSGRRALQE
mmetsp:Transcript_120922/g.301721  ORF Transcript_120922/g.301721 Transcript_120922/m.301721 type:complete len:265 (-) Transcript_120922:522-1316(-)